MKVKPSLRLIVSCVALLAICNWASAQEFCHKYEHLTSGRWLYESQEKSLYDGEKVTSYARGHSRSANCESCCAVFSFRREEIVITGRNIHRVVLRTIGSYNLSDQGKEERSYISRYVDGVNVHCSRGPIGQTKDEWTGVLGLVKTENVAFSDEKCGSYFAANVASHNDTALYRVYFYGSRMVWKSSEKNVPDRMYIFQGR